MNNMYQHSPQQPFHVSVGAVLYNEAGKVCTHHFIKEQVPKHSRFHLGTLPEAYTFMRESMERGETIEEAVLRGLQEEFGATGTVTSYLGSTQLMVPAQWGSWEKTTLYFAVALDTLGERPIDDEEGFSNMVWMAPATLREKMLLQVKPEYLKQFDELKILDAFIQRYEV